MISRALRPFVVPLALFLFAAVAVFLLASFRYARADDPVLLDAGQGFDIPGSASPVDGNAGDSAALTRASTSVPATPASPCLDPDGPTGLQPCGPIPSILDQPRETWTAARYYWQVGGWPFTVFVLIGVAGVAVVYLRPRDKDGDGTPDPEGARGVAWAIAGAVLMVSVPLLGWTLRRAGVDVGAAGSGEAVAVAVVSAVGVAMGLVARALGLKMPAVR